MEPGAVLRRRWLDNTSLPATKCLVWTTIETGPQDRGHDGMGAAHVDREL